MLLLLSSSFSKNLGKNSNKDGLKYLEIRVCFVFFCLKKFNNEGFFVKIVIIKLEKNGFFNTK